MEDEVIIEQLIKRAIDDKLTLEIDYVDYHDEMSSRIISNVTISEEFGISHISAYCHKREANRTFKIDRIVNARIVPKTDFKQIKNYIFNADKHIFNLYGDEY